MVAGVVGWFNRWFAGWTGASTARGQLKPHCACDQLMKAQDPPPLTFKHRTTHATSQAELIKAKDRPPFAQHCQALCLAMLAHLWCGWTHSSSTVRQYTQRLNIRQPGLCLIVVTKFTLLLGRLLGGLVQGLRKQIPDPKCGRLLAMVALLCSP